ncbi:hypothetical protein CSB37_00290 [bacterium DOLZORAL124_38_8]|nr:MAG: hypothetical protein CSB37_00290 [bacterium DOLZORAL124_38_8]
MNYAKIIADAWNVASENRKIVWFAFVPSFVTVVVFVIEIIWQYFLISESLGIYKSGFVFGKIGDIISLISDKNLLGISIFFVVFVLIFTFLTPPWIEATMILSTHHHIKSPEKRFSLRKKVIEGFNHFFQLFKLHSALSPFSVLSVTFLGLTLFRYLKGELFSEILLPTLIIYGIICLFLSFFFHLAPYFIIHDDQNFGQAIRSSISLSFMYFGSVFGLSILMLLVNIRVILNVLVVLGIPVLAASLTTYFAGSDYLNIIYILAGILGVGLIGLSSYLTGILEVFSVAFWNQAYFMLKAKDEETEL